MNNTSSSTFKMFDTAVQGHQFNSVDCIQFIEVKTIGKYCTAFVTNTTLWFN